MYCNYCGSSNPDESVYCSKCGRAVKAPLKQGADRTRKSSFKDAPKAGTPGIFDSASVGEEQSDKAFPRNYEFMDGEELTQLREAYEKLRVPLPPGLRQELELRALKNNLEEQRGQPREVDSPQTTANNPQAGPVQRAIPFSRFQMDRIKRFAFGVNCLMGLDKKDRMDRRKARTLLGIVLDPVKTPDEQIQDLGNVLDSWIQFFAVLTICNRRERKARRVFVVLLTAAFLVGVYYWSSHGILVAIAAFVIGGISVFMLNLVVSSRYVWRGFSPLAWGLTHTEVQSALDFVINDPRWQADISGDPSEHVDRLEKAAKMTRLYTYEGKGISTKLKSAVDRKTYIVSTAPNPNGIWELAVFRNIFGLSNIFRPLRVAHTDTFAEAEKEHLKTEEMVMRLPREEWQNS